MTDINAAIQSSHAAISELREAMTDTLIRHRINRVPILDGSGRFIRIPKDVSNLSASEVLSLAIVVGKLVGLADSSTDTEAEPEARL